MYLISDFVTTTPGEPFRLLPFGTVTKDGKSHSITPSNAHDFKLPHYKPAIKLGSHKEGTPAGGHIVGLEVREDGLYAIPEWNEAGTSAVTAGAYRYQSPEVIWEGGGLENSITGEIIRGPIIRGAALTHNPALGEATAFYSVEEITNGGNETMEMVQVPASFWEKLTAKLFDKPEPEPTQDTPPPNVDEFNARVEQLEATYQNKIDSYAARIEALEAEKAHNEKVSHFSAELAKTALAGNVELAKTLANLEEETATAIVEQFSALSAQIGAGVLDAPVGGNDHKGQDPQKALQAAIEAYQAENGLNYSAALTALSVEKPELFKGVW